VDLAGSELTSDVKKRAIEAGILGDQLADLRAGLFFSMPISTVLSTLVLIMEMVSGTDRSAVIWFIVVNLINGARIALALTNRGRAATSGDPAWRSVRLRYYEGLALLSGFAWAYLAVLTAGYSSPQSSLHLIILAGISAGAVTYGSSRAFVAINFITPPLLVAFGCLAAAGDLDNAILAFTVVLFLGGLLRGSIIGQNRFCETSRLKHEARQFAAEMEERSRHDPLTGLLNRRGLEQAVDRLNSDDKPFVAMLVDLDGFKAVNDTYGHRVGDELLKSIARRLEQEAPQGAALARVGGDEFVVLFPVRISAISVTDLASRIAKQHSLRESVQVGASIGIYETDNPKLTDIMLRADTALFAAKRLGRNHFRVFDDKLNSDLERRHRIERDLKTAIDSGNLATWFQPVIRLEDNAIVGFEALLRWDHPLYGAVPPPDIVTAAREQGLLQLVTEKVLLNCCTMIANLKAAGRRDVRVAMNLSPRELEVGSVDALILDRLQARGLPTDMLEIEITEEAPLDHERVGEKLGRLSEAGISIVLDDFGTGFSTLVSLKDGWIRKIKIDQTFVRDLANSIKDQALVRSIIDLGRALGREVMAEGVETDADRQILRSLGCETAQGYYFSKALPMKEALDLAPQQLPEGAGRGAVQNLAIRMSGE